MFDLRSLEHSTIIYESADGQGGAPVPLIRLEWNKQDPNYLAVITMDSNCVVILDIRVPSLPAAKLQGHSQCVNSLAWAPHSSCHISTAGDDNQALIWDLSHMPKPIEGAPCPRTHARAQHAQSHVRARARAHRPALGAHSTHPDAQRPPPARRERAWPAVPPVHPAYVRPHLGVLRGVRGQPAAVVEDATRLGGHRLRQEAPDLEGMTTARVPVQSSVESPAQRASFRRVRHTR